MLLVISRVSQYLVSSRSGTTVPKELDTRRRARDAIFLTATLAETPKLCLIRSYNSAQLLSAGARLRATPPWPARADGPSDGCEASDPRIAGSPGREGG